jgi:class III poly(R)-hydroxyalkanoic acid synthase PhaE subunit
MADQASDFIRDDFIRNYQALAQQSWDAWTRQLQQQQQQPPAPNPFFTPPTTSTAGNETLERTLAGLKGYFDWMQGVAASGATAGGGGEWQQQLQQLFGGASQPFAQAFGGIDSAGAEGFSRQWQSWMQAAQHGGFNGLGDLSGARAQVLGPTPAFGQNREQQMQQQAMATAILESLKASARYQALVQRANSQGMERLQSKLAQHSEPGRQIESLKALYDLWIDASEEAYAEIALSEEFREVYGEMVNTQMRVRQLQLQQTEQICQQLGVPTRSEVSSLGERLQAVRRELAALKHQLAGSRSAANAAVKDAVPKAAVKPRSSAVKKSAAKVQATAPRKVAVKKAAVKKVAVKKAAAKKAAVVSKSRSKPVARANSRKRK